MYSRQRKPPIGATRRKRLLFSYAPDWIVTIALAVIFFLLEKIEGFKRDFSLSDTSLRHPYAVHERIPNVALVFICFVAPLVLQPVVNFLSIRSWWDLHNSTLGLILSLAMAGVVTQFTKITVGRPRPDVIDRCQPPSDAVDPTFGLSTAAICTQTDMSILKDGFRSFPSGHSSLSFAGLGFLAFYLAGKLHLFDQRGHVGKAWISLAPFAGAALVAISRTMDYRHHWHDVFIGSILGTVMAYFAYRQYYPALSSDLSHQPYSPRIKRDPTTMLPLHTRHSMSVSEPLASGSGSGSGSGLNHHAPNANRYDLPNHTGDSHDHLEGTVQKPEPGSLHQLWKEGAGEDGEEHAHARTGNDRDPEVST